MNLTINTLIFDNSYPLQAKGADRQTSDNYRVDLP